MYKKASAFLKDTWGRLRPVQKWLIGGLVAALALAIGLGIYLNRTEWVVLISDADPKDAAAVAAKLKELKVPYQPTGDGYTINVPKSEEYTAKLALAEAGLPKGGNVGLEIFETPKFGATDFDRKVNYLRAQQGELERALARISEVDYANVKLAIPDKSVFLRDQNPVTASVLIKPKTNQKLRADQVVGIVNFLANSVEGLKPENVTVVDDTGRLLSNGAADALTGQDADEDQLKRQQTLEHQMEQKVQTLLEPIFGPGNVVARVNLELNLDASRIETKTVGASTPKQSSSEHESTHGVQNADGTRPADANAAPTYQEQTEGSGTTDTWSSKNSTEYEVGGRTETTVVSPGAVKRVSAAITINRADLTADETARIKEIAAGATGSATTDVAVLNMSFSSGQQAEPVSAGAEMLQKYGLPVAGGLAILSLLGIGALMLRRRREAQEAAAAPALATELGAVPMVGTTLDVALGRTPDEEPGEGQQETGPAAEAAEEGPGNQADEGTDTQSARQQLELVIASKPRRQVIIGNQEIPEQLMTLIEELAETPDVCAKVLQDWLRGPTPSSSKMTGRQKVAHICINVGPDLSAGIIQHLADEEIEMVTVEIARAQKITAEERDDLLQEFIEQATAEKYVHSGGIDYARTLLSKALGERKAGEILQRLTGHLRTKPFDAARRSDPSQLAGFLENEHPQTIAVVLAHLSPDKAAIVLSGLPPERHADIIRRVATLDPTSPEMLREADRVLERKLSNVVAQESAAAGGVSWAVDVLNRVDRSTERQIMEQLGSTEPELANEISQQMFLFEDIVNLDDRTVQRILREVDMSTDVPLALKTAKEDVWRKVTNNISKRAAENLKESVELLGPVRIRDVEEAQARIVAAIRKLDEQGEIMLSRGGEDEFI